MFEKILVPVDGSPTSRKGLAEAIALARLTGGRIRLVHVAADPMVALGAEPSLYTRTDFVEAARAAARELLDGECARVKESGIPVDDALYDGSGTRLCDRVVDAARTWKADLIVIGTHGRRGVRRLLLGSDAEQILRVAPVPVLLVRADEPEGA